MNSVEIDTAAKRARLQPRKNPYWVGISGGRGGVSLGYRRSMVGAGVWIAKTIAFGGRAEERIGIADDAPAAADAIGYKTAVARALEWSTRGGCSVATQRPRGAALFHCLPPLEERPHTKSHLAFIGSRLFFFHVAFVSLTVSLTVSILREFLMHHASLSSGDYMRGDRIAGTGLRRARRRPRKRPF